jgi:hypothetical protein
MSVKVYSYYYYILYNQHDKGTFYSEHHTLRTAVSRPRYEQTPFPIHLATLFYRPLKQIDHGKRKGKRRFSTEIRTINFQFGAGVFIEYFRIWEEHGLLEVIIK